MAEKASNNLNKLAGEDIHPDEALCRQDPLFARLRECEDGDSFLEELRDVFYGWKRRGTPLPENGVTVHMIIGICQLACSIRDQVVGGKRESFDELAIPWLLKRKQRLLRKRPPKEGILEYMCRMFNEGWDQPIFPADPRPGTPGLDSILL